MSHAAPPVLRPARSAYDGIQGLRFVAALLVVILHATFYTNERLAPVTVWYQGGVGVDIFFVISGFVMAVSTVNLVGTRDGWKRFALRRLIRIMPLYWVATTVKLLTLIAVPAVVLHAELDPIRTVLSYVLLPSSNVDGDIQPLLAVGWTLMFEMAFYALFALALFVRISPLLFCAVGLGILATGSIFRTDDWPAATVYFNPIVLYFVVGMAIGRWTIDRSTRSLAAWLGGVAILWTVISLLDGSSPERVASTLTQHLVVSLAILVIVVCEPLIAGRLPRVLLYLGGASYSLYLFHPLIAPIVPVGLGILGVKSALLSVVLSVLASVLGACLIFRWVEQPMTRWLQKRFLRKRVERVDPLAETQTRRG